MGDGACICKLKSYRFTILCSFFHGFELAFRGQNSIISLSILTKIEFVLYFIHLPITQSLAMPPMTPTSPFPSELNLTFFSIPQSLLLQIGTASILLLLIAEKNTHQALQALGTASEEVFRGDRLPILDFPEDI